MDIRNVTPEERLLRVLYEESASVVECARELHVERGEVEGLLTELTGRGCVEIDRARDGRFRLTPIGSERLATLVESAG